MLGTKGREARDWLVRRPPRVDSAEIFVPRLCLEFFSAVCAECLSVLVEAKAVVPYMGGSLIRCSSNLDVKEESAGDPFPHSPTVLRVDPLTCMEGPMAWSRQPHAGRFTSQGAPATRAHENLIPLREVDMHRSDRPMLLRSADRSLKRALSWVGWGLNRLAVGPSDLRRDMVYADNLVGTMRDECTCALLQSVPDRAISNSVRCREGVRWLVAGMIRSLCWLLGALVDAQLRSCHPFRKRAPET